MSAAAAVRPQQSSRRRLDVIIVGAGFGGIAAAIELRRHGIGSVKILERAPDLFQSRSPRTGDRDQGRPATAALTDA